MDSNYRSIFLAIKTSYPKWLRNGRQDHVAEWLTAGCVNPDRAVFLGGSMRFRVVVLTLALAASLPNGAEAQEKHGSGASDHPPGLGDRIPDVEFEIVEAGESGLRVGDRVNLRDFTGEPVILEFWATWCAPCRIQHAFVSDLAKRYGPTIQVLVVIWQDKPEVVTQWISRNESDYPMVLDIDGAMASTFWVNSLPRLALLDQQQRLSWDTGQVMDDSVVVRLERMVKRE